MHTSARVLALLACVNDAARVLPFRRSAVRWSDRGESNAANVLEAFLLAFAPRAAFNVQSTRLSAFRTIASGGAPVRMLAKPDHLLSRRDFASASVAAVLLKPAAAVADGFANDKGATIQMQAIQKQQERRDKEFEDREARLRKDGVAARDGLDLKDYASGLEGADKNAKVIFGTPLYLLLRVREATEQQERLLRKNMFRDLQRNNIKMAMRMILRNYNLRDNLEILTSKQIPSESQAKAREASKDLCESLSLISIYFDPNADAKLTVDQLSQEKRDFILKALGKSRDKIGVILAYLPQAEIDEVQAYIEKENTMNAEAMKEAGEAILNPPEIYEIEKLPEGVR